MSEDCQSGGVPEESHVCASVEEFKCGEFKIKFSQKFDISTESGKQALNFHDSIVSTARGCVGMESVTMSYISCGFELLYRYKTNVDPPPIRPTTGIPILIQVGTQYYLSPGSIGSDGRMKFKYVQTSSSSAIWYLHAVNSAPNTYMIFNNATKDYHWMCITDLGASKVNVILQKNYAGEQVNATNCFLIHNGNKSITCGDYTVKGLNGITGEFLSLPVVKTGNTEELAVVDVMATPF